MAKTTAKDNKKASPAIGKASADGAATKLEHFADDLGKLLGLAQNKAESWLDQRKAIAKQLTGVRDTAVRLLSQLGVDAAPPPVRATPGAGKAVPVRRKKRTMSAEARARISAAQKARWAKQKKAKD